MELSSSFVSIVGLLATFKGEGRARSDAKAEARRDTVQEYIEWLRRAHHSELVALLESNAGLSRAIESLLLDQHEEVMGELAAINEAVSKVASGLPGFAELTESLPPEARLSQQAISILRQMNEVGASEFISTPVYDALHPTLQVFTDRGSVDLTLTEPRFVADDVETLRELGLLRPGRMIGERQSLIITRAGARIGGDPSA